MGFFSDLLGGGGSESTSQTVNTTTVNSSVSTVFETEELAKALREGAKLSASNDSNISANELALNTAKAKADLNQRDRLFQEIQDGLQEWGLVGAFLYAGYRINKYGRLF